MNERADNVAQSAAGQARALAGNAWYLTSTAARAPSVHNTQPWQFQVTQEAVELWSDPQRKLQADLIGREMLISCGAALYGLRLAVRSLGYRTTVELLPDPAQLRLLARVAIGGAMPMNKLERQMLAAVPHRHTHRGSFEARPLPAGLLAGLQHDALAEGAELALVGRGLPYERLARIVADTACRIDREPAARAEVRNWTRDPSSPARDGVPAASVAAGPPGRIPHGRLRQRDFDLQRGLAGLPGDAGGGDVPPAATAVLLTPGDRRADWLRAGQALQRLLLHAASKWVFASLYTQPLEDPVARDLIRDALRLPGHPQMVLQLGRASSTASTARRLPGDLATLAAAANR
jgi:nitroreductase